MFKKISYKLIFVAFNFCLFIFCLELFSRMLFPETAPKNNLYFNNMQNNLKIGPKNLTLRQMKNSSDYNVEISFNNYGFRDIKNLKNSKYSDFFVVGDSMSFGWGVEEKNRYSNILENLTNKNFYNISIPGNLENYELLIEYAEKNGAKINNLIFGFTMENDFQIYEKKININPKENKSKNNSIFFNVEKLKRFLTQNSSFYFIITRTAHRNEMLRDMFIKLKLINPNLDYIYYTKFSNKVINSTVNKLKNISKDYNSIILVIPSRALWYGDHMVEADQIHKTFINKLKNNKFDYLDLRKVFEKNDDPLKNLHLFNDGHWNIKGHEITAKEIFEEYFKNKY